MISNTSKPCNAKQTRRGSDRHKQNDMCVTQKSQCDRSVFSYLRMLTTWNCPLSPTARCSNRSISRGRRAHSSKPAAAACGERMAHTRVDRQTDGQTLYRFIDLAPHTMWAAPKITGLVAKYIHEKWPAEEDDAKAKTLCIISS